MKIRKEYVSKDEIKQLLHQQQNVFQKKIDQNSKNFDPILQNNTESPKFITETTHNHPQNFEIATRDTSHNDISKPLSSTSLPSDLSTPFPNPSRAPTQNPSSAQTQESSTVNSYCEKSIQDSSSTIVPTTDRFFNDYKAMKKMANEQLKPEREKLSRKERKIKKKMKIHKKHIEFSDKVVKAFQRTKSYYDLKENTKLKTLKIHVLDTLNESKKATRELMDRLSNCSCSRSPVKAPRREAEKRVTFSERTNVYSSRLTNLENIRFARPLSSVENSIKKKQIQKDLRVDQTKAKIRQEKLREYTHSPDLSRTKRYNQRVSHSLVNFKRERSIKMHHEKGSKSKRDDIKNQHFEQAGFTFNPKINEDKEFTKYLRTTLKAVPFQTQSCTNLLLPPKPPIPPQPSKTLKSPELS
ncbi:unnamed protein product [Moneuplotes crassus]|uniref:Uncharacterized protein n=1 Tax=Euplotes crassus TaxID=5936 RepID=A0AAD1USZ9_EUPCR|nr:unnamed protein product [Moneuplotes crassus]